MAAEATVTIHVGDCREVLRSMAAGSMQCVVTSPPYWGLRDYGIEPVVWGGNADCRHEWGDVQPGLKRDCQHVDTAPGNKGGGVKHSAQNQTQGTRGQWCALCGAWLGSLGSEPTIEQFVRNMVEVFREVWRVLRDDGTLWLNLGDCYDAGTRKSRDYSPGVKHGYWANPAIDQRTSDPALKAKDLCGVPWRVALALQAEGWWLRCAIPWLKKNPMPESTTDRPTTAHETVFLLAKHPRYYYDATAVRRPAEYGRRDGGFRGGGGAYIGGKSFDNSYSGSRAGSVTGKHPETGRNLRTTDFALDAAREQLAYWQETVASLEATGSVVDEEGIAAIITATEGFSGAHFATFPRTLAETCIKAGTSEKGCCGKCGAAWVRVVERKRYGNWKQNWDGGANEGHNEQRADRKGAAWQSYDGPREVGWRPGCECDALPGSSESPVPWETVPCVVLDPFLGVGTVGLVAKHFGRSCVGIEIKREYADMAAARIAAGYKALRVEAASEAQMELFGEE